MKKHTEKPPIDELFARKLGNMSMPPSTDGFARLQARMGQQKPEAKIVFWRNPAIQPYMAAAACLLLLCLFGWLYWPSGGSVETGKTQIASNQSARNGALSEKASRDKPDQPQVEPTRETTRDNEISVDDKSNQVAVTDKAITGNNQHDVPVKRSLGRNRTTGSAPVVTDAPMVALTQTNEGKTGPDATLPTPAPATSVSEPLADSKPIHKPAPATERVLEVTIAEPQTLVAARQAAKAVVEEKAMIAQNEKSEKETRTGGLWQQVKRIKQGEIFARQDNATNEESGLLGRAYSGLKHTLDKDKSVKQ